MDTEDYESKVSNMLSDAKTYEPLKNNPTGSYKRKLIATLQRLKRENKITPQQYDYLYLTSESIPRLYCMPKIHKKDNPLRPIVDYTGSIAYNVSRALADLLAPLVGKTQYHCENSKQLAEVLSNTRIEDDEIMISHDVVSLFTNTPIDSALDIIRERLNSDMSLKKRTKLDVNDIMELLRFVLTTTYFQFRGNIYRQKFGAAMGSPVSPIVSNLFMEHLEQRAIATAPAACKPKLWKRYVDDIFEIIKKGETSNLADHINSVDNTNNIKFTFEEETDGQLSFLDALVIRKPDGSLKLQVYRKQTHTNQYLNFFSHHPLHQKLGVIRTLFDRSNNIVTEEEDKKEEEEKVKSAMMVCGYPDWAFDKVREKMERGKEQKKERKKKTEKNTEEKKGMVVIPYVQGLSESLERSFKVRGIQTAMRPHTTIRSVLVHPKDKRDPRETSGVVYKIPCKNCEKCYIGETGRNFGYRLDEHQKDVTEITKKKKYTRAERKASETEYNKSALTDHAAQKNHLIDWEGTRFVDREAQDWPRRIRESIWIRRESHPINRDEGGHRLSHLYDPLFSPAPAPPTIKRH